MGRGLFDLLLEMPWHGLILLDRQGAIAGTNEHARLILNGDDELGEQDGFLFARSLTGQAKLRKLLEKAMDHGGQKPVGGFITLRRRRAQTTPLSVHAVPVTVDEPMDFDIRHVAAVVCVVDPEAYVRIDQAAAVKALGLTPAQSVVATLLAEGQSVRDIADATGRKESSVRSLIKQVYARTGVSRQVDLVRMVLRASSVRDG